MVLKRYTKLQRDPFKQVIRKMNCTNLRNLTITAGICPLIGVIRMNPLSINHASLSYNIAQYPSSPCSATSLPASAEINNRSRYSCTVTDTHITRVRLILAHACQSTHGHTSMYVWYSTRAHTGWQ